MGLESSIVLLSLSPISFAGGPRRLSLRRIRLFVIIQNVTSPPRRTNEPREGTLLTLQVSKLSRIGCLFILHIFFGGQLAQLFGLVERLVTRLMFERTLT